MRRNDPEVGGGDMPAPSTSSEQEVQHFQNVGGGQCPGCGVKTHAHSKGGWCCPFRKSELSPIDIPGLVKNGKCLRCNPMALSAMRSPPSTDDCAHSSCNSQSFSRPTRSRQEDSNFKGATFTRTENIRFTVDRLFQAGDTITAMIPESTAGAIVQGVFCALKAIKNRMESFSALPDELDQAFRHCQQIEEVLTTALSRMEGSAVCGDPNTAFLRNIETDLGLLSEYIEKVLNSGDVRKFFLAQRHREELDKITLKMRYHMVDAILNSTLRTEAAVDRLLESNSGIDLYVALDFPLESTGTFSNRATAARAFRHVEDMICSNHRLCEQVRHICLSSNSDSLMEDDLILNNVQVLLWFAEGVDVRHFLHRSAEAQSRGLRWPELTIMCMMYGAQTSARKAYERFCQGNGHVCWIEMDPFGTSSLGGLDLERCLSVFDVVLHNFVVPHFGGMCYRRKSFAELKRVIHDVFPNEECRMGMTPADRWTSYCNAALQAPSTSNNRAGKPVFSQRTLGRTKDTNLDSGSSQKLTSGLNSLSVDIGEMEQCFEYVLGSTQRKGARIFSIEPSKTLEGTQVLNTRNGRASWARCRAVAYDVCSRFAFDDREDIMRVFHVASSECLMQVNKRLTEEWGSALIWVDFVSTVAECRDLLDHFDGSLRLVHDLARERGKMVVLITCDNLATLNKMKSLCDSLTGDVDSIRKNVGFTCIELKPVPLATASPIKDFYGYIRVCFGPIFSKSTIMDGSLVEAIVHRLLSNEEQQADCFKQLPAFPVVIVVKEEHSFAVKLCLVGLMTLFQLRDKILGTQSSDDRLMKEFKTELTRKLSTQTRITAEEGVEDIFKDANALYFDKTLFAYEFEKALLRFDKLTSHQEQKMKMLFDMERNESSIQGHVNAVAGSGKTFLAMYVALRRLQQGRKVLFACTNCSLGVHFAKWMLERDGLYVLDKLLLAFPDSDEVRVVAVEANSNVGVLMLKEASKQCVVDFIIVDEGHNVYCTSESNPLARWVEECRVKYRASGHLCELLVLSDESQAQGSEEDMCYPSGLERVELTEVVRNTGRVMAGALPFSITSGRESLKPLHEGAGPPLRWELFDRSPDQPESDLYAMKTKGALEKILSSELFEGLVLDDRLVVIVPDIEFKEKFKVSLGRIFPNESRRRHIGNQHFIFIDSLEASCCFSRRKPAEDEVVESRIVVDTIDNLDGLERLLVVGVALDNMISPTDTRTNNVVRSRIYRSMTRATLLFYLINERIRDSWFEWLRWNKFSQSEFSFDSQLMDVNLHSVREHTQKRTPRTGTRLGDDNGMGDTEEQKHSNGTETSTSAHGVHRGPRSGRQPASQRFDNTIWCENGHSVTEDYSATELKFKPLALKEQLNAFDGGDTEEKTANLRDEVEELVRRVVPEEIDNIDEMMLQFSGREEELVETLRTMQERSIDQRARAAAARREKVAAKRSLRKDGHTDVVNTETSDVPKDRIKEEQDALAQAEIWMKIASQGKSEDGGASDAADWAIGRSLAQLSSAEQQKEFSSSTAASSGTNASALTNSPPVTRNGLDSAIEAGDWAAIGATAALLAAAEEDEDNYSKPLKKSTGSQSRENDKHLFSNQNMRAAKLDNLIDAGDWENVVLLAAEAEASKERDKTVDG